MDDKRVSDEEGAWVEVGPSLRESERKAAKGLLETFAVMYLLLRHPGAMATAIVIGGFLAVAAIALVIDLLAFWILGHEIIGTKGR